MKMISQPNKPRNIRTFQKMIQWAQQSFSGMFKDIPASSCPDTALARAINILCFGDRAEVRPGTKSFSATRLPYDYIKGPDGFKTPRNGMVCTKSGTAVIRTFPGGATPNLKDFTANDVGNYIQWADGFRDKIIQVLSPTLVAVVSGTARTSSYPNSTCGIVGKINCRLWHEPSRKLFLQLGSHVVYTDWDMVTYYDVIDLAVDLGSKALADSRSSISYSKNQIFIFNENGIYQIDTEETIPVMFRTNTESPISSITEVPDNQSTTFGRRYLYTLTRQNGTSPALHTRADGNKLIKESSPNPIRKDDNARDYKEVWRTWEISERSRGKFGLIYGPHEGYETLAGSGLCSDIATFSVIELPLQGFSVTISTELSGYNGVTRDVVFDIRGVSGYYEMAIIMQKAMRNAFADVAPYCGITFEQDQNAGRGRFILTAGNEDGSRISEQLDGIMDPANNGYIQNIHGPSTSGDPDYLNLATGTASTIHVSSNVVSNTISDEALLIGEDDIPYTHYSVYAIKNLRNKINNSEFYVWLGDFPVAKAFCGSTTGINVDTFTASSGTFTKEDIGSILRVSSGGNVYEFTILSLAESSSGESIAIIDNIGSVKLTEVPACIGGGKVMKVAQNGNLLTKVAGDSVLIEHMNMMVFWHDGTISYAGTYFDTAGFYILDTVHDGQTGYITIAPTGRNFNDTVSDVELGYRENSVRMGRLVSSSRASCSCHRPRRPCITAP
jgi:hypothetical protein